MDPKNLWAEVTPCEISDEESNDSNSYSQSETLKFECDKNDDNSRKKKRKRDISPTSQMPLTTDSNQVCSKNCKICELTEDDSKDTEFKTYYDMLYDNNKFDSVMCTKKIMKRFGDKYNLSETDETDIMIHFNMSKTKFENNVYRNMVRMINSSKITPSQLLQYFQFAKEEYSKVQTPSSSFWS